MTFSSSYLIDDMNYITAGQNFVMLIVNSSRYEILKYAGIKARRRRSQLGHLNRIAQKSAIVLSEKPHQNKLFLLRACWSQSLFKVLQIDHNNSWPEQWLSKGGTKVVRTVSLQRLYPAWAGSMFSGSTNLTKLFLLICLCWTVKWSRMPSVYRHWTCGITTKWRKYCSLGELVC